MSGSKDHFSSRAAGYAAHRPTYPTALVDFLAQAAPAPNLALDCGCGSGQLSVLLATRFSRVVATDASPRQIDHAASHPGVEYRIAPADRSGLGDASVDLVTAAQAAHWFDLESFYAEVRRVTRPGAALALVTYGAPEVNGRAGQVVRHFHDELLEPYWPPERRHVDDGYRSLPFPFTEIPAPVLTIELRWKLADLVGYLDTWSAVRKMEAAVGRAPFDRLVEDLIAAWGDPAEAQIVSWPLSLRVGRV